MDPELKDKITKLLGKGNGTRAIGRLLKISPQRVSEVKKELMTPPKKKPLAFAVPPASLEPAQTPLTSDADADVELDTPVTKDDLGEYARKMKRAIPISLRVKTTKFLVTQTKNPAAAQRALEHADAINSMVPDNKPSSVATVPIFALPKGDTPNVGRVKVETTGE